MPLLRIEIEQLAHDRFHVIFEGAGSSANVAQTSARSFDEAVTWIITEQATRQPVVAVPRVPDMPLAPGPKIAKPVGKGKASDMRAAADEAADAQHAGLSSRRTELEGRKF